MPNNRMASFAPRAQLHLHPFQRQSDDVGERAGDFLNDQFAVILDGEVARLVQRVDRHSVLVNMHVVQSAQACGWLQFTDVVEETARTGGGVKVRCS